MFSFLSSKKILIKNRLIFFKKDKSNGVSERELEFYKKADMEIIEVTIVESDEIKEIGYLVKSNQPIMGMRRLTLTFFKYKNNFRDSKKLALKDLVKIFKPQYLAEEMGALNQELVKDLVTELDITYVGSSLNFDDLRASLYKTKPGLVAYEKLEKIVQAPTLQNVDEDKKPNSSILPLAKIKFYQAKNKHLEDQNSFVALTKDIFWSDCIKVDEGDFLKLAGKIKYFNIDKKNTKKALVCFIFLNNAGEEMPTKIKGIPFSEQYGHYSYINIDNSHNGYLAEILIPKDAAYIKIGLCNFYVEKNERVEVSGEIKLIFGNNLYEGKELSKKYFTPINFLDTSSKNRELTKPNVLCILDEFSTQCFSPECNLIPITPSNWRNEIFEKKIDFVLVESAWHGNNDAWLYRIAKYDKPRGNEILDLLSWARKNQVPSVFWNKEDPPNFDRFKECAVNFDYIYTTDENCVDRYKKIANKNTFVGSLPFAAQPSIHNFINDDPRLDASFFAGTYYADDYRHRREMMDILLNAADKFAFDIFDRQFSTKGPDKDRYIFPEDFRKNIKGGLSYQEILKMYSSYRIGLNVNSVSDSPTMFSRRVFEMLSCGTPVVSTPSIGIENYFKGVVSLVNKRKEADEVFDELMLHGDKWVLKSIQGIRKIHKSNTYAHRMRSITQSLGLSISDDKKSKLMVILLPNGDQERFINQLHNQTKLPDELILPVELVDNNSKKTWMELNKKIPVRFIRQENLYSYIKDQPIGSIVAICDTRNQHGKNYFFDAQNSLSYSDRKIITAISSKNSSNWDSCSEIGSPMSENDANLSTLICYSCNIDLLKISSAISSIATPKLLSTIYKRHAVEFLPFNHRPSDGFVLDV